MELIGPADPAPVAVINPSGRSPFLLLGDHAGIAIPEALGTLGLKPADLERHIASDIGIRGLGEILADALGAVFIHQSYSRLVVDCNRDPASAEAIPERSDGTRIAGNIGLTPGEAAARIALVHTPYHQAIAAEIARRSIVRLRTIVVALHSFTPVMNGQRRPWDVGVLHDGGDTRFARLVLGELLARDALTVGDNAPYRMDATDYTVPLHAYEAGLPYVEIEVRQDRIADDRGQMAWADILSDALERSA